MLAELERLAALDERREAKRAARAARPEPAPDRATARRVEPALAATARELRAERARRGWETRRANIERLDRQVFKANPAEVAAGDFAYQLYDNAHPLTGDPDSIDLWDRRLRGYYGERVRVTLNGYRTNPDTGERHRIYITRTVDAAGYASFFGPGSVYAKMCKVVRNIASEDELVTTSLTVELADGEDDGEDLDA